MAGRSNGIDIRVDYSGKLDQHLAQIDSVYDAFDLPYNGTNHDSYYNNYFFDRPGYWDNTLGMTLNGGESEMPRSIQDRDLLYYYHRDHLGSSTAVSNDDGKLSQQIEYLPYGEVFLEKQMASNDYHSPYKFNGKELDEETGLYYYGARYMNPRLSIWYGTDPLQEKYPERKTYEFVLSNPINNIDPNGESTHTDSDGKIVSVIYDDDLGVYKHPRNKDGSNPTAYQISVRHKKYGSSANGERMGETAFWDEFISPEDGSVMTNYRIQFGKSFDPVINKYHNDAKNMDLIEIARESDGEGDFNIKLKYGNVAGLLDGKYATSRSAGNFLAGNNAQSGTIGGIHISFETFQKLAGALHIEESHGRKLSNVQKFDIVTVGKYVSSNPSAFKAPTWGEVYYQYRMSKMGWLYGKSKK